MHGVTLGLLALAGAGATNTVPAFSIDLDSTPWEFEVDPFGVGVREQVTRGTGDLARDWGTGCMVFCVVWIQCGHG